MHLNEGVNPRRLEFGNEQDRLAVHRQNKRRDALERKRAIPREVGQVRSDRRHQHVDPSSPHGALCCVNSLRGQRAASNESRAWYDDRTSGPAST